MSSLKGLSTAKVIFSIIIIIYWNFLVCKQQLTACHLSMWCWKWLINPLACVWGCLVNWLAEEIRRVLIWAAFVTIAVVNEIALSGERVRNIHLQFWANWDCISKSCATLLSLARCFFSFFFNAFRHWRVSQGIFFKGKIIQKCLWGRNKREKK